jgi:hypothetical protein
MSQFMIPLHDPRIRRSLIACGLLGLAVGPGCESKPETSGPQVSQRPKMKRLQDAKSKADAAKK